MRKLGSVAVVLFQPLDAAASGAKLAVSGEVQREI